jgi:hypothetical protein
MKDWRDGRLSLWLVVAIGSESAVGDVVFPEKDVEWVPHGEIRL